MTKSSALARFGRSGIIGTLLWLYLFAQPLRGAWAQENDQEAIYVRSRTPESGKPLRWMQSNCVLVQPNQAGSDDIEDGSDLEAVQRAVDHWNAAVESCSYLRLQTEPASADAVPGFATKGRNTNAIYWIENDWPLDEDAPAITITSFIERERGDGDEIRILDADVQLNGEYFTFSSNGESDKTDIENTLVHELGHILGLDHTCDDGERDPTPTDNHGDAIPSCLSPLALRSPAIVDATMFNFARTGETKKRTPEAGDILGICETYPVADDPRSCSPVDITRSSGCAVVSSSRSSSNDPFVPATSERNAAVSGFGLSLLCMLVLGLLVRIGIGRRRRAP